MTSAAASKTPMVPIVLGMSCRGFLLKRRDGFESYDIDERSLGIFPTERDAIAAIFAKPIGRRP